MASTIHQQQKSLKLKNKEKKNMSCNPYHDICHAICYMHFEKLKNKNIKTMNYRQQ